MKLKFLTIYLFTSICAWGQETVLKEKKGESYYVLKDNSKIKHGAYQYSTKKGLVEKGQYDHDKKVGAWEFYDAEGVLEQKYDYSTKQLIFNKDGKPVGNCQIMIDGMPTNTTPDTPPVFIGGQSRYDRFIADNLKYPSASKSKGTEGRQIVLISLSKQGAVLNAKIYRPISPDIDAEALRLINELPGEWIPARHQMESVDVLVGLPVLFRLD